MWVETIATDTHWLMMLMVSDYALGAREFPLAF